MNELITKNTDMSFRLWYFNYYKKSTKYSLNEYVCECCKLDDIDAIKIVFDNNIVEMDTKHIDLCCEYSSIKVLNYLYKYLNYDIGDRDLQIRKN
jgi:hypothetical protein